MSASDMAITLIEGGRPWATIEAPVHPWFKGYQMAGLVSRYELMLTPILCGLPEGTGVQVSFPIP